MNFLKKIFFPFTWTISLIQNNFKAMIFLLILFLLFAPKSQEEYTPNNLMQINLIGAIMDVSEVLTQIEEATKNEHIKGILLVVDSPGGSVAPSVEIAHAIKRAKAIKPVVVYAQGTIASGSYYASIWADEIIANPGSMVGSIGVIMQGADLSGIMETIGIKTQVVQAGKYKQVGTPERAWRSYEIEELSKVIQGTYDMFSKDVADARGLDFAKREEFADAHIFTASQAQDVGLIDRVGLLYDAKESLIKRSGVAEPIWNEEDPIDKFMKKISASAALTLHTYFPPLSLR